jgi:hypothetical protein
VAIRSLSFGRPKRRMRTRRLLALNDHHCSLSARISETTGDFSHIPSPPGRAISSRSKSVLNFRSRSVKSIRTPGKRMPLAAHRIA